MFTGIVEEQGAIHTSAITPTGSLIKIAAHTVLQGTKIGDSIAVNGVCLTVKELGADYFCAEILTETLNRTTIGKLRKGTLVNLERAMTPAGRLGGHIVTGHIDGVGSIAKKYTEGADTVICVTCDKRILISLVTKGSVALDGVSLTVTDVSDSGFAVHLIRHTLQHTTLQLAKVRDEINIETDIIGKYVEKMAGLQAHQGITEAKLREEGYL